MKGYDRDEINGIIPVTREVEGALHNIKRLKDYLLNDDLWSLLSITAFAARLDDVAHQLEAARAPVPDGFWENPGGDPSPPPEDESAAPPDAESETLKKISP